MRFSEFLNIVTNLKNSTPYEYNSKRDYIPYEGLSNKEMEEISFEVLRTFQDAGKQKGEYIYKEDFFGIMSRFFKVYAKDGKEAYKKMLDRVIDLYINGDSWENYKKTPTKLFNISYYL